MKLSKKLLLLSALTIMTLTGCSSNTKSTESPNPEQSEKKAYTIGISQIAEHSALDDVKNGFEEELKAEGIQAKIIVENAQGDVSNANMIAQKFVKENVDLILAIGTPSAQAAKTATQDIPILFAAVTDPVKAELVNADRFNNPNKTDSKEESKHIEDKNISGTTDTTPMKKQLELFKQLNPDTKNIGIVFNTAEVNSQVQIEQAKFMAKQLGLDIVTAGMTNINEMPQAVDSVLGKVDGLYTITDNLVANAISVVASKALEQKKITVGAEKAHVEGGILMTDGISYFNTGKQVAQMAKRVLVDKEDISKMPVEAPNKTEKVVNEDTMKALGLNKDNKAFEGAKFVNTTTK